MTLKYNFYELRKTPLNKPLPEDVNEFPESVALKLGGEGLLAQLRDKRAKRFYGTIAHIDKKTNAVDGQFIFQEGICIRFKLTEYPSEGIIIERSVHNKNLSLSKTRYSERPEGEEIHAEE